ncbi:MAG: serine/threonine protein kinase [Deltaproteobacteria bacterium]|nr:serine/threonine protein kinase [Deltaproteobacteria bacterium]
MTSIANLEIEDLLGQDVGTATILKELARGGSAIVFVAFQRTLKRQIAVKILPKALLTPTIAERFQMEAESTAILSHPNIIQIYEVGETDEFLFFAMQLIQGRSVADYIKKAKKHILPSKRVLPVGVTVDIVIKVLDALAYAHSQKKIHRDIKPGNILIETQGNRPIVVDFGIAKVSQVSVQKSSVIQGTPVYMPQEQILNKKVDERADIYATGVMLFEMLVSDLPFPKWSTALELMKLKLKLKDNLFQKKSSEMNDQIHPIMDKIISKAISFDPEKRYPTSRHFLDHLEKYRDHYLKGI